MRSIQTLVVCIGLFLLLFEVAEAQRFEWAFNPKGLDYDMSNDIISDPDGNFYLTGYFRSATLDYSGASLTNTGGVDGFGTPCFDMLVAKSDSSSQLIWARSFGQMNFMESGQGIAFDQEGNTYVTGWFTSSAFVLDAFTLNNGGGWDGFIAKFDTAGNVAWAFRIGGSADDVGTAIAVDPSGDILVTGYYYSSSLTFGTTTLTNSGSCDVFLAKYDPNGNVIWAKKAGGSGQDLGKGLDTDPSGNIYMCGQYSSSNMNFGSHTLATSGSSDVFIAKYDSSGTDLWAKKGGGNKLDHGFAVAVNGYDGCVITGAFSSASITFAPNMLTNAQVNMFDVFVVLYDSAGTVQWAKKAGMAQDDIGRGIAFDPAGNIYVTGDFISPQLTFGGGVVANSDTTGTFSDVFVVSFDNAGNERWIRSVFGLYNENCYAVGTDHYQHAYLTGSLESLNINFNGPNLLNSGQVDLFVCRMGPDTTSSSVDFYVNRGNMRLYPNPVGDHFFIEWDPEMHACAYYITDVSGRNIRYASIDGASLRAKIDTEDLEPGLYFLRLVSTESVITQAFIKY